MITIGTNHGPGFNEFTSQSGFALNVSGLLGLAAVAVVGFAIYWFWRRKKSNERTHRADPGSRR